jgi:RNA polymerase sigma-70 factor (ECF subfamily)
VTASPPAPPGAEETRLLVARIQRDDDPEGNFAKLHRMHQRRVLSFFLYHGFDIDACENLTQDTFLRVYRSIGGCNASTFDRWLAKIMTNVYRDEIGRRAKQALREVPLDDIDDEADSELSLIAAGATQLEAILGQERGDALRLAIDALPDRERKCVQFRYYHGFKQHEIAEAMRIEPGTVGPTLRHARLKLAKALRAPSPVATPARDEQRDPQRVADAEAPHPPKGKP